MKAGKCDKLNILLGFLTGLKGTVDQGVLFQRFLGTTTCATINTHTITTTNTATTVLILLLVPILHLLRFLCVS